MWPSFVCDVALFGLVRIQSLRVHNEFQHLSLLKLNNVHVGQTLGTSSNSLDNLFGVALSTFLVVIYVCSHLCDEVPVWFSQERRPL